MHCRCWRLSVCGEHPLLVHRLFVESVYHRVWPLSNVLCGPCAACRCACQDVRQLRPGGDLHDRAGKVERTHGARDGRRGVVVTPHFRGGTRWRAVRRSARVRDRAGICEQLCECVCVCLCANVCVGVWARLRWDGKGFARTRPTLVTYVCDDKHYYWHTCRPKCSPHFRLVRNSTTGSTWVRDSSATKGSPCVGTCHCASS